METPELDEQPEMEEAPASSGFHPLCCVGEEHDKKLNTLIRIEQDYRLAAEARFRGIVKNWKRYYNERTDNRIAGEDWRAFTKRPTAFQITETLVAVNVDLVTSADPMVQTEGVGYEDDPMARAIEKQIDWAFRRNKFPIHFEHLQRAKRVQGTTIGKVTWQKRGIVTAVARDTQESRDAFEAAVREAERQSRVPAPTGTDPVSVEAFDLWRETVNSELGGKVVVPPIPTAKKTQLSMYEGPVIERPSIFTFSFDPTIETIQEQKYFFQKIPVCYQDILDRSDDDPNSELPYVRSQVEAAKSATSPDDYQNWNKEVAALTGLEGQGIYDETQDCELMEVWCADYDTPFIQILNRKTIINKHPDVHPFAHGMKPYFMLKNTPIENQFLGMSEFEPAVDLYEEENKLSDLLMDAVVMSVLPVLLRSTRSGFNLSTAGQIRPGAILDIARPDALKTLDKMNPGILDAFREIGALRDEIDNTHATWGNVRGAGANVGRVSATDSVNRMNQALVRQKIHAQRDELDLQDAVLMILGLLYQFGSDETKVNVGGSRVVVPRERFLDAIFEDFKFRGATRAINKAERIQSLVNFDKNFKDSMVIGERRALMKEVLHTEGIKAIDKIVNDTNTAEMVQAEQLAKQAALAQAPGMMGGGPSPGAAGGPPLPSGMPPPDVIPQPADMGQEAPLALLEQVAQGRPFEYPNAANPPSF